MRGPAGSTRFVSFLARDAKPSAAPLAPAVERVGGREHGVDGDVGGIRRVSLWHFRLASWFSLSIGGWQPSGAAAPAISFLIDRRRRWPRGLSSGVGVAATGLRRRGEGSVIHIRCPHARARRAPIPASSDADRPARAGWAALRLLADVAISF